MGREKLEVVPYFCYLGDCLSSGGSCELATITRCHVAWGKFYELLPILTSHSIPITLRWIAYNSWVRSAMLHASETWTPTLSNLHLLQLNNRVMIRWMCGVATKNQVSPQDLLQRMQLDDLAKVLCTHQHWWHGHVEHSNGWLKKVQKLDPTGGRGRGGPKKTWTEVIDIKRLVLGLIDQSHRHGRHQAACREPAGSYDKTTGTTICFEHKTRYLLIGAPYTRIVVFWHISNIPPMISQSQISCNTPTFYKATIFVKYFYTTGRWLL